MSSTSYSCLPSTSIGEGGSWILLGMVDIGKVPTRKHETQDGFSYNLKAWIKKSWHWFVSQWIMDLAFDDPTSLMALLSWYVVIKTKLGIWP